MFDDFCGKHLCSVLFDQLEKLRFGSVRLLERRSCSWCHFYPMGDDFNLSKVFEHHVLGAFDHGYDLCLIVGVLDTREVNDFTPIRRCFGSLNLAINSANCGETIGPSR